MDWAETNRQRLETSLLRMNEVGRVDGGESEAGIAGQEDLASTDSSNKYKYI